MEETKAKKKKEWANRLSPQDELLLEALDAPLHESDPEMVKRKIAEMEQREAEAMKKEPTKSSNEPPVAFPYVPIVCKEPWRRYTKEEFEMLVQGAMEKYSGGRKHAADQGGEEASKE